MHKHEFVDETRRLFKGSGCADDLTNERLDVLWETFGALPLEVWRAAVSRMLLDPYKPTASRMQEAVGVVEEQIRLREVTRRNEEARGFRGRVFSTGHGSAEFVNLSSLAGQEAGTYGQSPGYVADLLTSGLPALTGDDAAFTRRWIDALRDSPEDWAGVPRFQ